MRVATFALFKLLIGLPWLWLSGVENPPSPDGQGTISISGEAKTWHKLTLTLDGPWAHEQGLKNNPFTHYQFDVQFTHSSGSPSYLIPGYFAADGNAAETSATSGTKWRAHLSPDKPGTWEYTIKMARHGKPQIGSGRTGTITVEPSQHRVRARGRLQYVGKRYLQFAGDKSYFLKAGTDSPETLLAYKEFDGTRANRPNKAPLKTYQTHISDWHSGDPTWQTDKGKGLIGAINYLASKGVNSVSFLPYNAGGDGDNVWPFIDRNEKFHYDVSKLDQWSIVFDHATDQGLHLHFKLQETEIDDHVLGRLETKKANVPTALDGGQLGPERKTYLREIIARFSHNLALNWNLGEENSQSPIEQRNMAQYINELDPYQHPIVIHTYPNQQDSVYRPLLGDQSRLTGASLQNPLDKVHKLTLKWIEASAKAGKPWVVANDEQNPAGYGVPIDPGYQNHSGWADQGTNRFNLHDIRRDTLWGNLMAGGAGVEYYFGYKLPENDLLLEDFRSRDQSWEYSAIALNIFHDSGAPFWQMHNANSLVGNPKNENGRPWCLAKPNHCYLIYAPQGSQNFSLGWPSHDSEYAMTIYDPLGKNPPKTIIRKITTATPLAIESDGKEQVYVLSRK